jgi:hypothetical protein
LKDEIKKNINYTKDLTFFKKWQLKELRVKIKIKNKLEGNRIFLVKGLN